jgi:hypothetical protein
MAGKTIIALAFAALLGASAFAAQDEFVKVDMQGKLHVDTKEGRATLEAGGTIYGLDFGNSDSLMRFANRHDRDSVRVIGSLDTPEGVRPMVYVDRFEANDGENVSYEKPVQRVEERPVIREREVIHEHHHDPFIKVGPLRIGN